MATELIWPSQLPLPTFQGYAIEPLEGVLRTEMSQGAARQRQQYTSVPERVSVRWRFSQWQYALFRSWYKNKAKRGAEYFSITLLTGLGMVPHEARFAGSGNAPYHTEPQRGGKNGTIWIVTTTLEVRDSPDLSEDVLDLALTENMDGLLAAMDGVGELVNVTLPGLSVAA